MLVTIIIILAVLIIIVITIRKIRKKGITVGEFIKETKECCKRTFR